MKWYERNEEVYFHVICALLLVIVIGVTWPMQPWTLHQRIKVLEDRLENIPEVPDGR